jgi:hypothetical protein
VDRKPSVLKDADAIDFLVLRHPGLFSLTPLIYAPVNPYGRFDLDLDSRIDFGKIAAASTAARKCALQKSGVKFQLLLGILRDRTC